MYNKSCSLSSYLKIKLITLSIIIISCNKEPQCPYEKIDWNIQTMRVDEQTATNASLEIGGKLDSFLKRLGKGTLDAKVKTELNNYSNKISNSEISYDKEYVERWNALVEDICGKINLLTNANFSDSTKYQLEKQILLRVVSFYETVTNPIDTTATEVPNENSPQKNITNPKKVITKKEKEYLEVSIQLEDFHEGYKSIFVDNKNANILPSSTNRNLRLKIESIPSRNQKIVIVTGSNDSCFIEGIFDVHSRNLFPRRFVPNCKLKN